jgi:hypothetical protein
MAGRKSARGKVKGSLQHAEGQQGEKTHARLLEQLKGGASEMSTDERLEEQRVRAGETGKRRLVEDRQQHDEAEKNSEHTRLFEAHTRGLDDGPSDNTGNLHGVLEHREHRADHKERDKNGLTRKRRPGGGSKQ